MILIAEDEEKIAYLLRDYLQNHGFETSWLANGLSVVDWVRVNQPQLILLDLMLPGKDGLDICREIRGFSQVPIIVITARDDEIDRVTGLELGADDYIGKPFSPREVVARVKSVLRRSHTQDISDGSLQWDAGKRRVSVGNHQLELTPHEFNLIGVLCQNPERVFTRDQLLDRVYQDGRVVTDRTIDSHVKNLRKKLEPHGLGDCIVAIYGVGYKWQKQA